MGKIIAICTGDHQGLHKKNVDEANLIKDLGLEGGDHAGLAHRQLSLLALESIKKIQGRELEANPGDFAGSLITTGIDLLSLPVGTRLAAGKQAVLRITGIGKEYHRPGHISDQAGNCAMSQESVFAEVMRSGTVSVGNSLIPRPSYSFAVITASDKGAAGEREDKSGPLIAEILKPWGDVKEIRVLPDEPDQLAASLIELADSRGMDAIFTTGGTGLSPRDITPEATLKVVDRLVPGIPEALRRESAKVTPKAMLSRGVAGLRGQTLIINLPGSPKAVQECFQVLSPVLDHALEVLTGQAADCAR